MEVSTPQGAGSRELSIAIEDNIIPSPEDLKAYKELHPNAVDFFIDVARKEQEHRHEIERQIMEMEKMKVIEVGQKNKRDTNVNILGMTCATIIVLGLLALSGLMFYFGITWGGIITLASAVLSVVPLLIKK